MKELKTATFEADVINNEKPVVVDFWASWCGPCKMMAPIFEELEEEFKEKFEFGKVNVDEEPALAEKYGIVSIPTIILIKDGQVVNRSVGAVPKAKLAAMLG